MRPRAKHVANDTVGAGNHELTTAIEAAVFCAEAAGLLEALAQLGAGAVEADGGVVSRQA